MFKQTIIIIIAIIISLCLYFGTKMGLWVYHCNKHIQQRKNLIFNEIDHEELLSACRVILENPRNYTYLRDPNWPLIIKKRIFLCRYSR